MATLPHYDPNGEVNSTNLNAIVDETNINTGKRTEIDANTAATQQNTQGIQANTSAIQQNTSDIQTNATAINNNATAINQNAQDVSAINSRFDDLSYIPFYAGLWIDNTTPTNIPSGGVWQKSVLPFSAIHSKSNTTEFTGVNSEITYNGTTPRTVTLILRVDGVKNGGGGNEDIEFQFRKNGNVLPDNVKGGVFFESNNFTQPILFNVVDIVQGDVLQVWEMSNSGVADLTVRNGIFAINL